MPIDPKAIEIPISNGKTQCVTFRPNGHCVGAHTSGDLRQWKVDGGEVSSLTMKASGNVYGAVASMDGKWIVSGDLGYKVIVWNAVTHQKAIEISDHTNYIYTVDVSGDSKRIVSGSQDYTARIFDIVSGTRVIPPLTHDAAVIAVKFSPDGSRIATATYQHTFVGIFDSSSGNKLFEVSVRVTGAPITPLAWSPDGKQLFIATPGTITSFDTSTSSRSDWAVHGTDCNTAIVTHGQFIACSAGPSVTFWDHASRQQIGTSVDHTTNVGCISISRDGRYIACGRDNGITIHNLTGLLPEVYLHASRLSRIPLMEMSEEVLKLWTKGNSANTESKLSEEIAQCCDPNHHALAARSLVRSHLKEWEAAIEDAELSLGIKQSPIGHIARSLALVGAGKQDVALDDFDFAFRDGDQDDIMLLLVIKSILVFMCGKRKKAVSRLLGLITASSEGQYSQVLGNMYLKQGDYENAMKTLQHTKNVPQAADPLVTISLIFNWSFDDLEAITWQRRCETLYTSGCIKQVGETLEKMVDSLAEDEKEPAHGRVLQEIITRSGQVTLLSWTGKSSACNSCLPHSPAVYSDLSFVPPSLGGDELRARTDELRTVITVTDALVVYGRVTRLQPVRFAYFRLLLPCIVFGVTSLRREQGNLYHAEAIGLGSVQFTTTDSLPLKDAWRLVFVDIRIHGLQQPCSTAIPWENPMATVIESGSVTGTDADAEVIHGPIIEEVSSTPSDPYTQALELIAHLGQPFSALLLLRQPDGTYKRVAADHEIVVSGMGNNVPKDICVEVLEVL